MTLPPRPRFLLALIFTCAISGLPNAPGADTPPHPPASFTGIYNVRDFGATGSGTTLDTRALQAALDKCATAGGGIVLLPPGRYLTGTLYLKSQTTLRLENGAILLGSVHAADYTTDTYHTLYKNEPHMDRCLIFAHDAENISIEGRGIIDGQGASLPEKGDSQKNRPMLLRFLHCSNIRVRDVTLRNPAAWTSAWLYSRDLVIEGVTISSRANINGDGLDFDGCQRVRVSNCSFDNSDDCICLQTSLADEPCRDVSITNCTMTSRWAGIRIGLLSRGNFENIALSNCTFRDIRDSGIKIQEGEGAEMSNMSFTNLVMRNVLKPIFLTFTQHRAYRDAPEEFAPMKSMRGFLFSNILVETETGGKDAAFIITGLPGHPIEDVTLENIRATFSGGGTTTDAHNVLGELDPANLQGRWPEYSRFNGAVPAFGLYARHVRGLTLHNVDFKTSAPDARPPTMLVDVSDPTTPPPQPDSPKVGP